MTTTAGVSEHLRERLAALADTLIPPNPPMPSASDAGVAGEGLDRVLRARPGLTDPLVAIVEASGEGHASAEVSRLRSEDPGAYSLLVLVVCSAYYTNDEVKDLIGYPGQVPVLRPDLVNVTASDPLLQPVIQRGVIYRMTP
jgi:hypothetical protein